MFALRFLHQSGSFVLVGAAMTDQRGRKAEFLGAAAHCALASFNLTLLGFSADAGSLDLLAQLDRFWRQHDAMSEICPRLRLERTVAPAGCRHVRVRLC